MKAAFHSSPSLIRMLLYPHCTSNLVKREKLAEVVDEIGDQRQGVCVLYCMFVEIVVVLDWSKFSVLLFDEEEGGGLRGF